MDLFGYELSKAINFDWIRTGRGILLRSSNIGDLGTNITHPVVF